MSWRATADVSEGLERTPPRVLSPAHRLVLLLLADHTNVDGTAWPSLDRLARMAGVSTRWVRTIIRDLEGMGWVSTTPKPGHTNVYRVHPPSPTAVAASSDQGAEPEDPPRTGDGTAVPGGAEPQFRGGRNSSSADPIGNRKGTERARGSRSKLRRCGDCGRTHVGSDETCQRPLSPGATSEIVAGLRARLRTPGDAA